VTSWDATLRRWTEAGLIEPGTAERIRGWEHGRAPDPGARWPARLALGLGGLMVGAGVLLFVATHWDGLSPGQRFALIVALIASLHLAGSASERSPALAATLHACGTVALGAGVFLTGQIFHLREHWPAGLLLWALGAWAGWALLRQWPQAALAAVLTPAWLAGEWLARADRPDASVVGAGILLLALAYLGAESDGRGLPMPRAARRALTWIGGLALIPAALYLVSAEWWAPHGQVSGSLGRLLAWTVALALPLVVSAALRGSDAVVLAPAAVWAGLGPFLMHQRGVAPYLWAMGLAAFLIWWGLRDRRGVRINLGMAGFALTVTVFYFSDVMDRLGRSASLISMGLLFLGGGYLLEQTRRRLLDRVRTAPS
jgi:uncharacterized membrane protein